MTVVTVSNHVLSVLLISHKCPECSTFSPCPTFSFITITPCISVTYSTAPSHMLSHCLLCSSPLFHEKCISSQRPYLDFQSLFLCLRLNERTCGKKVAFPSTDIWQSDSGLCIQLDPIVSDVTVCKSTAFLTDAVGSKHQTCMHCFNTVPH